VFFEGETLQLLLKGKVMFLSVYNCIIDVAGYINLPDKALIEP
jgi:hypothetical protein